MSFISSTRNLHRYLINLIALATLSLTAGNVLGTGYDIEYSTFHGGGAGDFVTGSTSVDTDGNLIVTGFTRSIDFPINAAAQTSHANPVGNDVFVSKYGSDGSSLIFSTYLGGSGNDYPWAGTVVDGAGNIYVAGLTTSIDFPTTVGSIKPTCDSADAFIAKYSPTGAVVFATCLGGSGFDQAQAIALDTNGNIFVAGITNSANFPVSATPVQSTFAGGTFDGFVAKLDPTGSTILYATYIGGSGDDKINGIVVDPSGSAHTVGRTTSTDYPLAQAFQTVFAGSSDGFYTRLNPSGSSFYASSYIGGSGDDQAVNLQLDSSNNPILVGVTDSVDFPTVNAFQSTLNGATDAFIVKLTNSSTVLNTSSYFGGSGSDGAIGVAIDAGDRPYLAIQTNSTGLTAVEATQSSKAGDFDGYVVRFSSTLDEIDFSTYLGGASTDNVRGIAVDSVNAVYLIGETASTQTSYPLKAPLQSTHAGGIFDAFVAKLAPQLVRVDFECTVDQAHSSLPSIPLGSQMTGSIIYRTQDADLDPDPTAGRYSSTVVDAQINVVGNAGIIDLSTTLFNFTNFFNNFTVPGSGPVRDQLSFGVPVTSSPIDGFQMTLMNMSLIDSSQSVFSDDSIQDGYQLSQFDGVLGTSTGLNNVQLSFSNGSSSTGISCNPNSVISTIVGTTTTPVDTDLDGVLDINDNCPTIPNPNQTDTDTDGIGDACDADDDNDNILDGLDNCPLVVNADQLDSDGDSVGDACDADLDGDGIDNNLDNCPTASNNDQTDTDGDGQGDECDTDDDNDGVLDGPDNCPVDVNPDQLDFDGDNIGDVCDSDLDNDGLANDVDNCPVTANSSQDDTDSDGEGDACDIDDDNDAVLDVLDNCSLMSNTDQLDTDGDSVGDVCDLDLDGDGVGNTFDNCPNTANSSQNDFDGDGLGDACDLDSDNDGVTNTTDVCPQTTLGMIVDGSNGCSIDQLCPCSGPRGTTTSWRNHGKYVSCTAHAANDFRDQGLISQSERSDIVSAAANSNCGKK